MNPPYPVHIPFFLQKAQSSSLQKGVLLISLCLFVGLGSLPKLCAQHYRDVYLSEQVLSCHDTLPWTLVFHDEFEGAELDEGKWFTFYPYGDRQSADDSCAFCRTHDEDHSPNSGRGTNSVYADQNVRVAQGNAVIYGRNESISWFGETYSHSTGVLFGKKNGRIPVGPNFRYGKVEIRCLLPQEEAWYPSFWMYGHCGDEIDLFEAVSTRRADFQTDAHSNRVEDSVGVSCRSHEHQPREYRYPDMREQYRTFTLEWCRHEIRFYYEGENIQTIYRYYKRNWLGIRSPVSCGEAIPSGVYVENLTFGQTPMVLIAGMGLQDDPSLNPQEDSLLIDYIRVWQKVPNRQYTDCEARVLQVPDTLVYGNPVEVGIQGENTAVVWEGDPHVRFTPFGPEQESGGIIEAIASEYAGPATLKVKASSRYCAYKEIEREIWISPATEK